MNRAAPHSALCAAIRDYLRLMGAWEVKVLGSVGQRPGVPDFVVCIKGRFVAVEVKTGTAILDANQIEQKRQIEQAGGLYIVARRVEDVKDALEAQGLARMCTLW